MKWNQELFLYLTDPSENFKWWHASKCHFHYLFVSIYYQEPMKRTRGEFKIATNMLYLYEIVERTLERHFEGNHYIIAH
jgi:hypothetical protein